MRLTQAARIRSLVYHGQTSTNNLGDLHQRMRCVRQLAQKHRLQLPSELYQAIFDLELEVSFHEPAKPPYGQRTCKISDKIKRLPTNPGIPSNQVDIPLISSAELNAMHFPPHPPEPALVPRWSELAITEPRLRDLERVAIKLHAEQNDPSWGYIKQIMCSLVGWGAEKYALRTATAYDVAYDHLSDCFDTGKVVG